MRGKIMLLRNNILMSIFYLFEVTGIKRYLFTCLTRENVNLTVYQGQTDM